jgi:succinoglycan biosynthesis transport protein ExoP
MGDSSNADADSLDYSMTLETEANILESNTLALDVIKDLKLETTEDYYPQHKSGISIPAWVLFGKSL